MDDYYEAVRAAVEKHKDASGAVPAGKVAALLDDLADVVEAAYGQGLEDAQ
jgi:hypothetical protein